MPHTGMSPRTKIWLSVNQSSESRLSRVRSGPPKKNAYDPRNQARRTSKQLHKLQTRPRTTLERHHANRQDQAANGQESTHGAADRPRMGRQGPWGKTLPPGTGHYPPGLNPKRSEKGDGLVPKQNEPIVSEADSEANQR